MESTFRRDAKESALASARIFGESQYRDPENSLRLIYTHICTMGGNFNLIHQVPKQK